jgi:hypothetical protein
MLFCRICDITMCDAPNVVLLWCRVFNHLSALYSIKIRILRKRFLSYACDLLYEVVLCSSAVGIIEF